MLYYLPDIKLKMDIDDVPDNGQPMSTGPKVLPDELVVITDCAASLSS
jgi:hypothetical protein